MVVRKFPGEPAEQIAGTRAIAVASGRYGQQQTRVRQKVMPLLGSDTKLLQPGRTIGLRTRHAKEPPYRGRLQTQQVILYAHGEIRVVIRGMSGEKLFRDGAAGLHVPERSEIALLDERDV